MSSNQLRNRLIITLGGKRFRAKLLYDKAPNTIAAFEQRGAFTSIVFSAKICSNEITWNTPVDDIDYLENKVLDETPGNIVFFPPWGSICVFYGPTEPAGWCTKFAELEADDLDGFTQEADKVWGHQGGLVVTEFEPVVDAANAGGEEL